MVYEFLGDLFRKRKDKPASQDDGVKIRELDVFQRLKEKFAGNVNFKEGFQRDSLTVGDLIDVLYLYLECAGGSTRGVFSTVSRVARLSIGTETQEVVREELARLSRNDTTPGSLDRGNVLYSLPADLQRAVEEEQDELSHYPGGIKIREKPGCNGYYEFFLTNRQSSDDGRPIQKLFEETGLPVSSNIRV